MKLNLILFFVVITIMALIVTGCVNLSNSPVVKITIKAKMSTVEAYHKYYVVTSDDSTLPLSSKYIFDKLDENKTYFVKLGYVSRSIVDGGDVIGIVDVINQTPGN